MPERAAAGPRAFPPPSPRALSPRRASLGWPGSGVCIGAKLSSPNPEPRLAARHDGLDACGEDGGDYIRVRAPDIRVALLYPFRPPRNLRRLEP